MIWRVNSRSLDAAIPSRNQGDPPTPLTDNLYATAQATGIAIKSSRVGDLKLFEPKTMRPIIAVRDREGR
jgi:hypothetical protein